MNNILIFVMFMNVFGFGLKTERNPKCLTISDSNAGIYGKCCSYLSTSIFTKMKETLTFFDHVVHVSTPLSMTFCASIEDSSHCSSMVVQTKSP